MYTRETAILAKIESTEGTDPTPTGSSNAIMCANIKITPIGGSTKNRRKTYTTFGAIPLKHADKQVLVEFDFELAGSGTAGNPPAWGVLARGCGNSETIVASTSVTYAPISASQDSVTLYCYEAARLHKLLGARGNLQLNFVKDDVPYGHGSFVGRWSAATAASLPSQTMTAWQEPLILGKINTPTFSLHSFAAVLESLTMDMGNKPVHKDRPNAEYVVLTDRMVTGDISFVAPALGSKDYFADAVADTQAALQLIHGTAAGNIITLNGSKVQLIQPGDVDLDGEAGISAKLQFNPTSGDDDFSLVLT